MCNGLLFLLLSFANLRGNCSSETDAGKGWEKWSNCLHPKRAQYHWCSAILLHFPALGLPPPSEHMHEGRWMLFKAELSSPPISQHWEKSVDVGVLSSHFPSNRLVSGAVIPCCGYTLPMFPRCIWHKEEKAVLQNRQVFKGTFMYPTGICKPSFQIKSSKKSNFISDSKMCMSSSWRLCLINSTSKSLKHPHPRDKKE